MLSALLIALTRRLSRPGSKKRPKTKTWRLEPWDHHRTLLDQDQDINNRVSRCLDTKPESQEAYHRHGTLSKLAWLKFWQEQLLDIYLHKKCNQTWTKYEETCARIDISTHSVSSTCKKRWPQYHDISCQHTLGAASEEAMLTAQTGSRPDNTQW